MAINPSDIYELLGDQMQPAIRRKTLEVVASLNSESCVPMLSHNDFAILTRLIDLYEKSKENGELEFILRIFVNATSAGGVIKSKILAQEKIIRSLWENFENEETGLEIRKLSAMTLSNLTIDEEGCKKILEIGGLEKTVVNLTMGMLKKVEKEEKDGQEIRLYSAYILRNLTQIKEVRTMLVTGSNSEAGLAKLLPILARSNDILKFAVVDIVRNCCFDTDLHPTLISMGNDDFLSAVLYPLIGGEQFTDDENEALPIDLQYMDSGKQRDSSPVVRLKILEALYQLCATSESREYLRNKGTYYVLREYHKWEQENLSKGDNEPAEAELVCANVIGVLIRTEDEMGCDNLRLLEETDPPK